MRTWPHQPPPPQAHTPTTQTQTQTKTQTRFLCVLRVLRVPGRWFSIGPKPPLAKPTMQDTQDTRDVGFHLPRTLPCPTSGSDKKSRFCSQGNRGQLIYELSGKSVLFANFIGYCNIILVALALYWAAPRPLCWKGTPRRRRSRLAIVWYRRRKRRMNLRSRSLPASLGL